VTNTRRGSLTLGIVAFACFFVLFFTGLAPFDFEFPGADMEGSWILASVYAGLHHFAYGTQFVFTNGPFFPLYHREWADGMSAFYIGVRLATVLYLAAGFAWLSATAKPSGWIAVIVGAVILWPSITYQANDGILLIVPLLTAMLVLADRGGWPLLVIGLLLSAMTALAKLSFIPFCLGAFVLVDVALLSRRRPPIALLGYIVLSFVLFVASGQHWDAFVPFLVGSYEMTSGYTAALALDGPILELLAWLALALVTLILLLVHERIAIRSGTERPIISGLRLLLVIGFLFIALKAGFVRHDGHSIAAWGLLLILLVLLGLPASLAQWRLRRTVAYYAVPAVGVLAFALFSISVSGFQSAVFTGSARVLGVQLQSAVAFAQNPSAWLQSRAELSRTTNVQTLAVRPVPILTGTVDAISNIQASVIAAGLDYAPRPTIQENMTFSPALIARNAKYLSGPAAPDHLLFAPGATDGRHPASIEGSLWPLLLANYQIADEVSGQLVLDRRKAPSAIMLDDATQVAAGFGQDITLPTGQPIFLRLNIRETVLGRIADAAFKPPLVHLVETYADGRSETYRLIPGMISEGMVISPTIRTVADYRALASGNVAGLDAPSSIRIETAGTWAYDASITGDLATLAVPAP